MGILQILTVPNPLLKKISLSVKDVNDDIIAISQSMKETMYHHSNCVGIAAVQVGVLLRIIVIDISQSAKNHRNNGLLTMINPAITFSSGKVSSREGCLSVPDFLGTVVRKKKIEIEYLNLKNEKQTLKTDGFESIVLQHEIDHLDGKVFLDRVSSLKTDIFKRQ